MSEDNTMNTEQILKRFDDFRQRFGIGQTNGAADATLLAEVQAALNSQTKSVPEGYLINVIDDSWVIIDKEKVSEAEKHGFTVKPYYFAPQQAGKVRELRKLCGYVENGTSQTLSIFQDDATKEWHVRLDQKYVGFGMSFESAIDQAIEAMKGE